MKKEILELVEKIEKQKEIIAKERNKLWELFDELESIVSSLKDGEDSLNLAIQDIRCAIDRMSEYI